MFGLRPYVLIVDDAADGAESIAELLVTWGFDGGSVLSRAAALDSACTRMPFALILNLGSEPIDRHAFIAEFRQGVRPDAFLFLRAQQVRAETKLTQTAVYEMITSIAKDVGIEKRVSPHSCRATLATLLHNGGVPIGHIQELLNHKQITTTAIYIKKADELSEAAATKIDILRGD